MTKKQPAWITLEQWADDQYGEKAPHMTTLRRWVKESLICPAPEKVGRTWFVRPESQYTPIQKPAARHIAMPASNDPVRATGGKRLIDRIKA